ncbi:MAG: SAM-dependent methyltransferase [Pseudomonadota bacterium]|nr:SAM-dependent methyltransferase [Pseudomonadota bacterium]
MRGAAELSEPEIRHAERVHARIAGEIESAGGWIGFERYMELALYAPGLGYYSAGARKFGPGGDFTTAPEVSTLFGACLARQCAEILSDVVDGCIMEVGAGSGRLAVDVLTRLEAMRQLPSRYFILEVSADLRSRQRGLLAQRLPHLLTKVTWLDAPDSTAFEGVIMVNEVLDALPVARFRWHPTQCEELGVALRADRFVWSARPASPQLARLCDSLAEHAGGWEAGYVSEVCPRLAAWSRGIVGGLRRGAVLWLDYGLPRAQFYLPERREGTLICHFRQQLHADPFAHPGLEDISAWVDFTALAEACAQTACEVAGFTTQALFLAGIGIDREIQAMAAGDEGRFLRFAGEAKRLMLPGEMGESFKAMAWSVGLERALSGFALRDLRHSL